MKSQNYRVLAFAGIIICIVMAVTFSPTFSSALAKKTLTSHLEMGATELYVQDLETMTTFYEDFVGLQRIGGQEGSVVLGSQERSILRLISSPERQPAPPGSAGLYHTAIVFSSRANLAHTLARMLEHVPFTFQGSSDHIVSEAFYFIDPEGNGLELYFDKDASGWQWRNGQVQMGSRYIDPRAYIAEHGVASGEPHKKMGHIHLRVGDLEQAKMFYVTHLGLVITNESAGALFVSDGKYHHHFGLNVWESNGAGVRSPSLGLGRVEIFVQEKTDLTALQARLTKAKIPHDFADTVLTANDPWGNTIVVGVLE